MVLNCYQLLQLSVDLEDKLADKRGVVVYLAWCLDTLLWTYMSWKRERR